MTAFYSKVKVQVVLSLRLRSGNSFFMLTKRGRGG